MKQAIITLLTFLILFSCQNNDTEDQATHSKTHADKPIIEPPVPEDLIEYEPYIYDTILRGGYNLKFKVYKDEKTNEKLQSLTLRKGEDEIAVLNETPFPALFKNLGYIGADFDSSFVFVQSFGSGNSHSIQLIDKSTGQELRKGTWVDAEESEQVLLYIENEHEENERLVIYDVKNRNEITSKGFENSKCVEHVIGGLRSCVEIDAVTSDEIILKTETDEESIVKKYKRAQRL